MALVPAVSLSTTFAAPETGLPQHIYSRYSQPLRTHLETELAAAAATGGAVVTYSSGLAAIASLLMYLCPVVVLRQRNMYHGTDHVLDLLCRKKFVRFFDRMVNQPSSSSTPMTELPHGRTTRRSNSPQVCR